MAKYVFDQYVVFKGKAKANPDVIGEQLEVIAAGNGGRLQPAAVVTSARKRTSPLHQYFEWSDKLAAEAYRLDQARTLIRSVRIVSPDDAEPRHAYLSIADRDGTAYHAVGEVLGSMQLQLAVLKQAERDLLAFERRYRDLTDICGLVRSARERAADRIATASATHESRPAQ